MTERETLLWIKANLSSYISQSIKPGMIYSEDWISGMVMRETGILIMKWGNKLPFKEICLKMKGDYGKRPADAVPKYHGFGFMQIDIDSFPDFVNTGDWQDPLKTFEMAIKVLEEKRVYLQSHASAIEPELLFRATTAAYNCGQGNVLKAITTGKDIDAYTFNKDYSKEVWRFRKIYAAL